MKEQSRNTSLYRTQRQLAQAAWPSHRAIVGLEACCLPRYRPAGSGFPTLKETHTDRRCATVAQIRGNHPQAWIAIAWAAPRFTAYKKRTTTCHSAWRGGWVDLALSFAQRAPVMSPDEGFLKQLIEQFSRRKEYFPRLKTKSANAAVDGVLELARTSPMCLGVGSVRPNAISSQEGVVV